MARIEFICTSAHEGEDINRDGPAITLNEHLWAYCSRGGLTDHVWQRIAPTTLDEIAIASHRHTAIEIPSARA
jgi:hypothetical protein